MRIATHQSREPLEELGGPPVQVRGQGFGDRSCAREQDAPRCQPLSAQALGRAGGDARHRAGAGARRLTAAHGAARERGGHALIERLREAAAQAVELLGVELDAEVADAESSLDVLRSSEARRVTRAGRRGRTLSTTRPTRRSRSEWPPRSASATTAKQVGDAGRAGPRRAARPRYREWEPAPASSAVPERSP